MTTITFTEIVALNEMIETLDLEEVGYSDFFHMSTELFGSERSQTFTDADYDLWIASDFE